MTARQWNLLITNTEKSLSRRAVSLIKLNVQNKVLFIMLDLFVFRWPSMDEEEQPFGIFLVVVEE